MNELFSIEPFVVKNDLRHPGFKPWLERAKTVLGEVHPNRHLEWALARFSLDQKLTETAGVSLLDQTIVGYQRMKELPQWIFSLSHTRDWGGAWLVPSTEGVGVGLDLELKTRKISHEVFQRMHHADDMNLDLTSLWAVKEAAYKSLPSEIQDQIWLNSIKVRRGVFEVKGFTARGEWKLWPHNELIIATAVKLP